MADSNAQRNRRGSVVDMAQRRRSVVDADAEQQGHGDTGSGDMAMTPRSGAGRRSSYLPPGVRIVTDSDITHNVASPTTSPRHTSPTHRHASSPRAAQRTGGGGSSEYGAILVKEVAHRDAGEKAMIIGLINEVRAFVQAVSRAAH